MTTAKTKTTSTVKEAATKVKKPTTTVKKTAAKKPVVSSSESTGNRVVYETIQQAAYLLAEKNGFTGDAATYWLAAEAKIKGAPVQ
ncbi:MAG: DUF2934 domain-containing protein [Methylotenera sp.]|jgi:hypothetical protein|nr:DUF2934 domain-containing protein [Methylotenera sp.]PKO53511.1 MAG: hypothetical protein CVU27_01430 [Betaproteobacteria bacterium HGW-Betaproteobacteria-20]